MGATTIVIDGKAAGVICRPGRMERIVDEPHGKPRWCFVCRKVRPFRFTVDREIEPSYYEPNPAVRCAACSTPDGDCFPGRSREWEGQ